LCHVEVLERGGDLFGAAVALDGKPVNWSGINIYELDDDGLIRDAKAYFNPAVFQAQLAG